MAFGISRRYYGEPLYNLLGGKAGYSAACRLSGRSRRASCRGLEPPDTSRSSANAARHVEHIAELVRRYGFRTIKLKSAADPAGIWLSSAVRESLGAGIALRIDTTAR
jgi:L-alanine-DL-glutamate epimerase-like enolase superfamily enzyme